MFYIGLCIVFFLLDFAQSYMNTDWKKYAANIGKLMGGFLIVYVINTVATRLLFGVGEYTQSQIVWGRVRPYISLAGSSVPLTLSSCWFVSGAFISGFLYEA